MRSSMLTPKNRLHAIQDSAFRATRHDREHSILQLSFSSVVGTTTNSVNAFDALLEHSTFAYCAGSAAVLARVDEHLGITQHLFRVRPNASPINATSSFYYSATPPSTPGQSRRGSPLKDGDCGSIDRGLPEYFQGSPNQIRTSNRSRETSCVSLSHGDNLMAVGETGYSPRVLLYFTASNRPSDAPVSILSDHSFGISSIAFSQDSRWLCTLGNEYDGFIFIYTINVKTGSAKLHSSNKCSNVRRVTWMGHSVVSIGIRHVKVWRAPSSPSRTRLESDNNSIEPPGSQMPKAFIGRNCLLGPLIDATFTSIATVSDSRAVLCTAQGDICLLDDSHKAQRLERVAQVEFGILCVAFDHTNGLIWIGGKQGTTRSMHIDNLIKPMMVPPVVPLGISLSSTASSGTVPDTLAIGLVRDRVITIDSNRIIELRGVADSKRVSGMHFDYKRLPAHESSVLGVSSLLPKLNSEDPDFFTFSARGTVLFWSLDGKCTGSIEIPLDPPGNGDTNDLKIVVPLESDWNMLSGDRKGVLRLIDRSANNKAAVQAHSGDINGIAVANIEGSIIVATCGRDRTVQLFRNCECHLHLLQTLDDHTAAIGDVKFLDRTTLLSISSDRTIIVRKLAHTEEQPIAFLPIKVITLKASPVSFTAVPAQPNVVLVSTLDRQILRYDVSSGSLLHSFKALDPISGDSVMMSSLEVHELGDSAIASRLILGVSSTDKSIRIHEYDSGALLTREYGQNAVSAIRLLRRFGQGESPCNHLVSCGLDGTVMTWALRSLPKTGGPHNNSNGEESPSRKLAPFTQPLRRIFSKAELSSLQKSLASESNTMTPTGGPSPSHVRRKTSMYTQAAAPKIAARALPGTSRSPANGEIQRQPHTQSPLNQKGTPKSRSKTSLLYDQRRSKSAANLNDLNERGKQVCTLLRSFRNRIASSSVAKLDHGTFQELAAELNLTVCALQDSVKSKRVSGEPVESDLLDMYLARITEERLAVNAKREAMAFADMPHTEAKGLEKVAKATNG